MEVLSQIAWVPIPQMSGFVRGQALKVSSSSVCIILTILCVDEGRLDVEGKEID